MSIMCIKRSPWGKVVRIVEVYQGIFKVETTGTGGFKLNISRQKEMNSCLKLENGWYDEGIDFSRVILSFPQFFSEKQITEAKETLKEYYPEDFQKWIQENNQS